jgi:hypothetical protein
MISAAQGLFKANPLTPGALNFTPCAGKAVWQNGNKPLCPRQLFKALTGSADVPRDRD